MTWFKNRQLRPAIWLLGLLTVMALARDILANGRPLYCQVRGEAFFPALRAIWHGPDKPYGHPVLDSIQSGFRWRLHSYEAAVFAPIAFSPGELPSNPDTTVRQALPGSIHPGSRFRHWLGTDTEGHDVAAGMVGGARAALLTGTLAMSIAFAIGLTLGAIAGYWGDGRLRVRRWQLWALLAGAPAAWFYAGTARHFLPDASGVAAHWAAALLMAGAVIGLFFLLGKALGRWAYFARTVALPADLIIMRLAEVFTSIPGLLAIVAFAAMLRQQGQTLWAMTALIGAFSWPGVALFVRAELLRVRELEYVTAARGLGLTEWRILFRHALPNALRPTYTIFAFGVAGAILLEASLSFLGYGDNNLVGATWGSLLQNARSSPQLWWISLPPGLAICATILALHTVGEELGGK
ncbi:MAG: ABC transporter permease [Saprospiraceae bacterium]